MHAPSSVKPKTINSRDMELSERTKTLPCSPKSCSFVQLPSDWQNHPDLAFPGLITKKVPMTSYNASRSIQNRRSLTYYRVIGASNMPSYTASPNLHACAHLYASDRNGLFHSTKLMGVTKWKAMASLSHTVILHETGMALDMVGRGLTGGEREGRWMCQEAWTDRLEDGRITHHSRLWAEGRHVGTTLQDGMVRLVAGEGSKL